MNEVGTLIRSGRQRQNMKQQTLAERLGTTQSVVSEWENGTRVPSMKMLKRIAGALGLSFLEMAQAAAALPDQVGELQSAGLADALVADLVEAWPDLVQTDRDAVIALHRAILARYQRNERAHRQPEAEPSAP